MLFRLLFRRHALCSLLPALLLLSLSYPLQPPPAAAADPLFVDSGIDLPGSAPEVAAAWGDYDNDGDLDLVQVAEFTPGAIYRNDGGTFTDIQANLPKRDGSIVEWADYDNDGDLDLLLIGRGNDNDALYRNDSGSFTDIGAEFPRRVSAATWGDYDNDGDLDLLLGVCLAFACYDENTETRLYRNDNGQFAIIDLGLPGVGVQSVLRWGDYDNDGDLDLLLSGSTDGINGFTHIYRNVWGRLSDVAAGLPEASYDTAEWADFDQDGDLDLMVSGIGTGHSGSSTATLLYRNDSGAFTPLSHNLPDMGYTAVVAWGDYDNDGDLDLLVGGRIGTTADTPTQLWRNEGPDGATGWRFSAIDAGLPETLNRSSLAWGDYDNDGRLDILMTAQSSRDGRIFRNTFGDPNTNPSPPTGLNAAVAGENVTLSWEAGSDPQTPASGLSYALRVGSAPGLSDVLAPDAGTGGYRSLPGLGRTQQSRQLALALPPGTYYWSVQSIDASWAGSPFASEQSFTMPVVIPEQCYIAGLITTDTTLSPAQCAVYRSSGNVIVNDAVTLAIEPGTIIQFAEHTALIVDGTLRATGTAEAPITFTSSHRNPQPGDWGYIHFRDSSSDARFDSYGNYLGGSILRHCIVEYAGGADVADKPTAVYIENAAPFIDHNIIRKNRAYGIYAADIGEGLQVRISNNQIHDNQLLDRQTVGIYADGITTVAERVDEPGFVTTYERGQLIIEGNTVSGNNSGIVLYGFMAGTPSIIRNNTVTNNRVDEAEQSLQGVNYAVGIEAYGPVIISGNLVSNNAVLGNLNIPNGGMSVVGPATITNNTITGNAALNARARETNRYLEGGGLYIRGRIDRLGDVGGPVTISGNLISGNRADNGGGIYLDSLFETLIYGNTIISNTASYAGGGMYIAPPIPEGNPITYNLIADNSAAEQGGGVFLATHTNLGPSLPRLSFNTLQGNQAASGAALFNQNPNTTTDINVENNYWGTVDQSSIEADIYHAIDDNQLGLVDYVPQSSTMMRQPATYIDYDMGQPGSYFSVRGFGLQPGTVYRVLVNQQEVGRLTSNAEGILHAQLRTPATAHAGIYTIALLPDNAGLQAVVQSGAPVSYTLHGSAPLRPQREVETVLDVPATLDPGGLVYLPLVQR